MHFIKRAFISTYYLLYRTHVHDFLVFFLINRRNDLENIICIEARKCMFHALKKVWAQRNSKGFECEYGKCTQH